MLEPEQELEQETQQMTVEEAIHNLRHPDTSLRYYAAWWLGKFRIPSPEAVDVLIECLADEADRTELGGYPLRRNAARALGKMADPRAVPGLINCLECSDFYVRECAAEALGQLKDQSCVPDLMKLLAAGVAAAQQVPGRPHLREPYESVMAALGNLQATQSQELIEPFLKHSLPKIRYAAARAMYQITRDDIYGKILLDGLQDQDIKLRRVVLRNLGDIGYLPGAEAIAKAATEGSFKLIALKGLLDHQLDLDDQQGLEVLSQGAIDLMALMDNLL
jgi:phycocyanobilin lyase subunit alpha